MPQPTFNRIEEQPVELDTPFEAVFVPAQNATVYVFEVEQTQRIAVDLVAQDSGPDVALVARLFDEQDEIVPRAEASIGQPLGIDEWEVAPGHYKLQLFGPETTTRLLLITISSRPAPPIGGGTISYGEAILSEIAAQGQRDRWLFDGYAGEQVRITMITMDTDPYLELYNSAGTLLASNDDQIERNAAIELMLPADGTYTIVARMVNDDQTGTYRIALEKIR